MLLYQINLLIKRRLLVLILLVLSSNLLYSQNKTTTDSISFFNDSLDLVFGLDPSLYNGMLYKSIYPRNVKGNQYFLSDNYLKGEATIRGVQYQNIDLNLDIYKQELLLKYTNPSKGTNIVAISKAWLEAFTIGNTHFKVYSIPEKPKRIYQVLGNDSVQIIFFWKKDLKIDNISGNSNMIFVVEKESYLFTNKSFKRFKGNRSFVQLFTKEKQAEIKKYIKQKNIKVNESQDQVMEELINYCSKLQ